MAGGLGSVKKRGELVGVHNERHFLLHLVHHLGHGLRGELGHDAELLAALESAVLLALEGGDVHVLEPHVEHVGLVSTQLQSGCYIGHGSQVKVGDKSGRLVDHVDGLVTACEQGLDGLNVEEGSGRRIAAFFVVHGEEVLVVFNNVSGGPAHEQLDVLELGC